MDAVQVGEEDMPPCARLPSWPGEGVAPIWRGLTSPALPSNWASAQALECMWKSSQLHRWLRRFAQETQAPGGEERGRQWSLCIFMSMQWIQGLTWRGWRTHFQPDLKADMSGTTHSMLSSHLEIIINLLSDQIIQIPCAKIQRLTYTWFQPPLHQTTPLGSE